jgi:small multidrug resistance pump
MKAWTLLIIAIIGELVGTTCLKLAEGTERPSAWIGVVGGYGVALWLLTLVIKDLDLGVTYALWSGIGIVLAALVGVFYFGESMSWMRAAGILAIAVGIAMIELEGQTR